MNPLYANVSTESLFDFCDSQARLITDAMALRDCILEEIKLRIQAKENQLAQLKAAPTN